MSEQAPERNPDAQTRHKLNHDPAPDSSEGNLQIHTLNTVRDMHNERANLFVEHRKHVLPTVANPLSTVALQARLHSTATRNSNPNGIGLISAASFDFASLKIMDTVVDGVFKFKFESEELSLTWIWSFALAGFILGLIPYLVGVFQCTTDKTTRTITCAAKKSHNRIVRIILMVVTILSMAMFALGAINPVFRLANNFLDPLAIISLIGFALIGVGMYLLLLHKYMFGVRLSKKKEALGVIMIIIGYACLVALMTYFTYVLFTVLGWDLTKLKYDRYLKSSIDDIQDK